MAWATKGACGCRMENQTITIAVLYIIVGLFAALGGLFVAVKPAVMMTGDHLLPVHNSNDNNNTSDNNTFLTDLARRWQEEGAEVMALGVLNVLFSALVIVGVRKNRSLWFLPWFVLVLVDLVFETFVLLVELFTNGGSSQVVVAKAVGLLFSFAMSGYCVHRVLSHYVVMRKEERDEDMRLFREMDKVEVPTSSDTMSYERLQEEEETEAEVVANGGSSVGGTGGGVGTGASILQMENDDGKRSYKFF